MVVAVLRKALVHELEVKTAKRDALTTVMSVNFVRLLQISRNFIRIAEFQGTLACHSFACLSYFCGFHFPSLAAIIQHRILLCVEDSNRKLRAYFYDSKAACLPA